MHLHAFMHYYYAKILNKNFKIEIILQITLDRLISYIINNHFLVNKMMHF